MTFAGRATIPSNRIEYNGSSVATYAHFDVHNYYTYSIIATDGFNFFSQSPNDPTVFFTEVSVNTQPGYYPQSSGSDQLLDSLHLTVYWVDVGTQANGWKILPGRIDPNSQSNMGPTAARTNTSSTWRAYTPWDTSAYEFKWLLNGSLVSGAVGAQYSTSLSTGTHSVASVMIRSDGVADTVTTTVKVFDGAIDGPSSVRPFVTCSFSASAFGGTSPYSYSWTAPGGSASGSWFDYMNGATDGGGFTVQLAVTDASGATIYISKNVAVSSSAPECFF